MAKKNKGWDYLNSDDINSMSDGSKDDWGYIDSDGSGSFHGGDGSWGYKNADGSGSFYGGTGDSDSVYDEGDDDADGSSLGEALGTIVGAGIVGAMAAGVKATAEEREREAQREAKRREQARINSEKRRAWRKSHRKGIAITILIFIFVVLLLIGYYEIQKLIPMGYSSDSLEGLKYTEVVQRLKESGFSNVHTKEISDLTISKDDEENLVTEIRLIFGDSFAEDKKYPSNLWITVVYHTVELYASPLTSKEAKGMNYLDVIDGFEKAGFVNDTTDVKYDIVTGWLTDDGEVKSVSINGDKKFDSDDEYRLDAEVVITYHTWKKNRFK